MCYFGQVSQTVCQLCQEEGLASKVMSSSLLCMSELCRSLGPRTIPLLPSLLPTVLKQLDGAEDKSRYVCVGRWKSRQFNSTVIDSEMHVGTVSYKKFCVKALKFVTVTVADELFCKYLQRG